MRKALCFDDVLLVPKHFSGNSRSEIDISTEISGLELEIPLIAANMPSICEHEMAIALGKRGGLGILHRMCSIERQVEMVATVKKEKRVFTSFFKGGQKELNCELQVGASIGIGADWLERSQALIQAKCDLICIDVAFFAQDKAHEVAIKFQEWFPDVPLIVGNIATRNHIAKFDTKRKTGPITYKVGVGGSGVCSTRRATGAGQLTFQSVLDCREFLTSQGLTKVNLIGDGGHKNSGDCVKSLAAGRDALMIGGLFAGTDQSPGQIIEKNGKKYKKYFGNASAEGKAVANMKIDHIEGVSTLVDYKGDVNDVIDSLIDGIKSGMSYCGAMNLEELRWKAEFVEISHSGYIEGTPYRLRNELD